jgi:hypothetical protein
MLAWTQTLLLGTRLPPPRRRDHACVQQRIWLRRVWREKSFGLFRLFRLALLLAAYPFPALLIGRCLRKRSFSIIGLASDFYVLFRFCVLLWILAATAQQGPHLPVVVAVGYLALDPVLFVARVVFLADVIGPTLSGARSLLFLLVNYAEVTIAFAILYRLCGCTSVALLCPWQALYFSAVTATTLGYGDITPRTPLGVSLLLAQLGIFLLFLAVFFGFFLGRLTPHKAEVPR